MSSNNRLRFVGLDELRKAMRSLPKELTGEAINLVNAQANITATEIRTAYGAHRVSGRLQAGVIVTHVDRGKWLAGAIVKSTAKIASIFERGTQARHTDLGWNRGSMPPGNVFVPAMMRGRRRLFRSLRDLLQRKGLVVRGGG